MRKRISSLFAITALFFALPACAGPSHPDEAANKPVVSQAQVAMNNPTAIEESFSKDKERNSTDKANTSDKHIVLDYDVYAGGLHALKAQLGMELGAKDYRVQVAARTNGMIGTLLPWEGQYLAEGRSNGTDLHPSTYKSISSWRGEEKKVIIEYGENGKIKSRRVKEDGEVHKAKQSEEELTLGAVDILTGTAQMLQNVGGREECTGSVNIFDGKRRFKLTFYEKGKQHLKKSKYSRFEGDAIRCTVEVEPDGGRWSEKKRGWLAIQEHSREHGSLPEVWIARVDDGGPAIPVRMLIKSKYGAVLMHLTNGQISIGDSGAEQPIKTGMLFR